MIHNRNLNHSEWEEADIAARDALETHHATSNTGGGDSEGAGTLPEKKV